LTYRTRQVAPKGGQSQFLTVRQERASETDREGADTDEEAIASTILALTGLVATAPAAWGQETQCTGPLPPGTYITVVVPEGASCEINGNTTVRNVQVLAGGNLATSAATITGNITGVDVGFISVGTGTEVGKNVTIGGETVIVSDAEIGGNVRISGSEGAAFLTSSFVGRNVTIVDTSGFPFIEANEIGRNLRVRTASFLSSRRSGSTPSARCWPSAA
jgi:hypothetical protein